MATVEIRENTFISEEFFRTCGRLWLAIVTTRRGCCYFVSYTGDRPSEEKVLKAWKEDRRAFEPYWCVPPAN